MRPPRDGGRTLVLDDAALRRKLAAAEAYASMRAEVDGVLAREGIEGFRVETFSPAMPPVIVRYDEHFAPFVAKLAEATISVQSASGTDDYTREPPEIVAEYELYGADLVRAGHYATVLMSRGLLRRGWMPIVYASIGAYVAVDRHCRDRMAFEYGIPAERIRVLTNAVDLQRFTRRAPLPSRPSRALVFSNSAAENTWVPPIRAACERRGIALDLVGEGSTGIAARPEEILGAYDLTEDAIGAEIDAYDPVDAARVTDGILELLLDQYVDLYCPRDGCGACSSGESDAKLRSTLCT